MHNVYTFVYSVYNIPNMDSYGPVDCVSCICFLDYDEDNSTNPAGPLKSLRCCRCVAVNALESSLDRPTLAAGACFLASVAGALDASRQESPQDCFLHKYQRFLHFTMLPRVAFADISIKKTKTDQGFPSSNSVLCSSRPQYVWIPK